MTQPLAVLIAGDSDAEANVLAGHLRQGGFDPQRERVSAAEGRR